MSTRQDSTNGQTPQNIANLGDHSKPNELIELARSNPDDRLDVKMLDEFYGEVQTMSKLLKEMLTKAIHLHGELEKKEALARLINKSTSDLPKQFDEMIERVQSSDAEVLAKSKENLVGLSEEIRILKVNRAVNESMMKECADERKVQQAKKASLEEELSGLESKLSLLLDQLNELKQANDKLNDEARQSNEENHRVRRNLEELNGGLVRVEREKTAMRAVLDEKVASYNELKEKKQSLLTGTYTDEKTKHLKMQVDTRRDELKRIQQSIEEIKSQAGKPTTQIKLPRLKDEHLHSHLKTLLTRLSRLIELNYQHQYMLF